VVDLHKQSNVRAGFLQNGWFLQTGDSAGPVFDEAGKVIALVQRGTLPGTQNSDLVPIAPAIDLIKRHGVKAGIAAPVPFADSWSASCRTPSRGVENWTSVTQWAP
jgi:hypothetical protein